jgi:hypothetical protein
MVSWQRTKSAARVWQIACYNSAGTERRLRMMCVTRGSAGAHTVMVALLVVSAEAVVPVLTVSCSVHSH